MTVLYAILTALLQGIAEFLPVSSTGHLAAISNFLGTFEDTNAGLLFFAFLHLGTLISVFFSFRRELQGIFAELAQMIRGSDEAAGQPAPPLRMAFLVAMGTIPLLLAIPLYGAVRQLFANTAFIGVMFIASGAMLYVSARYVKGGTKTSRTFSLVDALIVGAAQLVSLIPGISRVGATVTVSLTRGSERDFAVRYSYLLSIPAVIGTLIAAFVGAVRNGVSFSMFPLCLLGMLISAIVGIFAIGFLRMMMTKDKFANFGLYNVAAGTLVVILALIF